MWEDIDGAWEEYHYPVVRLKGVWGKNACEVDELCYSGSSSSAVQGKLRAYGDRQGTVAKLIYADDTLTGITDRNDRQVLWFDYSTSDEKRKVIGIRDTDNRRIEYEVSNAAGGARYCYAVPQTLIYRFTDAAQHDTIYTYGDIKAFKWSGRASGSSTSGYSTSGSGGGGGGGSKSISCTPPPRLGLTSVSDALGRKKTITYDGDGAISSVLDDEGKGYHFQFSYDTKTREYYAQVRDTNGLVKEVWIDTAGNATRLDLNGRTVKTFAKDGNTYTITDENGNQTQKSYDQWDNLVKVVYPDGAEVKYEYDPTLHKVTQKIDENLVVTRYYYDTEGRLERRVETFGTDLQRTTEFSYDTAGNLATIRRPGDTVTAEALTTMTYDGDGNMLTLTDPEGGLTSFTYDAAGNVRTKTDL